MALKVMATGGVYLGGGIAPKIVAKLKEPVFMNAFTAKGRMKPLLQNHTGPRDPESQGSPAGGGTICLAGWGSAITCW